jgi:hypothetical protein
MRGSVEPQSFPTINSHRGVIHEEGIVLPAVFQISDNTRSGGFWVKRVRVTTLISVGLVLCASPAGAKLIPTTGSFFTAPADGTLTFTFEGYSADDTDQMVFAFNGDALFTNQSAAVGDAILQIVVAGQIYQLGLRNNSTGDTWSSDPASNWDGQLHLASTNTFSDFHLGAAVPTLVSTDCALVSGCYFGWEDLPGPGADDDFNDLVFALQFTPTSPSYSPYEPASIRYGLTMTIRTLRRSQLDRVSDRIYEALRVDQAKFCGARTPPLMLGAGSAHRTSHGTGRRRGSLPRTPA